MAEPQFVSTSPSASHENKLSEDNDRIEKNNSESWTPANNKYIPSSRSKSLKISGNKNLLRLMLEKEDVDATKKTSEEISTDDCTFSNCIDESSSSLNDKSGNHLPIIKDEDCEDDDTKDAEMSGESEMKEGEDSDAEMMDEEGAYHLAEVSYGEEDEEGSEKGSGENDVSMTEDSSGSISKEEEFFGTGNSENIEGLSLEQNNLIIFYCELCDYKTQEEKLFFEHFQSHSRAKSGLFCPHCNLKAKTPIQLKTHIRENCTIYQEKPSRFNCTICEFSTNRKDIIKTHVFKHCAKDPYFCNVCDFKTDAYVKLKAHVKTHIKNNLYTCDKCEYKTSNITELTMHARTHKQHYDYICSHCPFSCLDRSSFKKHMRIHTGEAPYQCTVCKKRFRQSGHLKEHSRIHTGDKPYSCTICDYRCAYSGLIKKHMTTHSEQRPFACSECSFQAKTRYSLNYHMRTHTGYKIVCQLCDFSCNTTTALKEHVFTHTGETPYSCELCDEKFFRKSMWSRHLRAHNNNAPVLVCKDCQRRFLSKIKLRQHQIKIHNM